MNHAHFSRTSRLPRRQSGVALVVALLLLVVITLVGLAAVRGTLMQQKMSANLFDRQIAFQSAEAAMRVAQARIADNADELARNCGPSGVDCRSDPFRDPNFDTSKIQTVTAGAGEGQFSASDVAASQPQYVIEDMGLWPDLEEERGSDHDASNDSYDPHSDSRPVRYYRITARSGDPDVISDRAVVTLQAMIKQG